MSSSIEDKCTEEFNPYQVMGSPPLCSRNYFQRVEEAQFQIVIGVYKGSAEEIQTGVIKLVGLREYYLRGER